MWDIDWPALCFDCETLLRGDYVVFGADNTVYYYCRDCAPKSKKCECGATAVQTEYDHSQWCPMKKEKK